MPLTASAVVRRLTAELNVTPGDLALADDAALLARAEVWVEVAAERDGTSDVQQYQHVKALVLRSWITALVRKKDEVEATGDVKVKSDLLGRIEQLRLDEADAKAQAGLTVRTAGPVSVNPEPTLDGWDLA